MQRMGMKPLSGSQRVLTGLPTPNRRRRVGDQSSGTVDQEPQVPNIIAKLLRSESGDLLNVLIEVNHTLSTKATPGILNFVAAGGVQAIIKKIAEPHSSAIYFQGVQALASVACSEQAKVIVESGGVNAIFKLLRTKSGHRPELCDQCLLALANLAGQSPTLRDALLDYGIIDVLGEVYGEIPDFSWSPCFSTKVERSMVWLARNLCQLQPAPSISSIVDSLDFFAEILDSSDDMQTLCEATMGISDFLALQPSEEEQLDFVVDVLDFWEVTGDDLGEGWDQIPGIARAKSCFKVLQEGGGPTPGLFVRLLNSARARMLQEFAHVAKDCEQVLEREEVVVKHDLSTGDGVHALAAPPNDVVKVLGVMKNGED